MLYSQITNRLQIKVSNRCNQIYIFIVYVLTLHVSGPYWPIIRGVLGCLFMPPFGSCSAVVCPCVRGRWPCRTQCTNFCLLRSDVVNYFLVYKYCIFLNWCTKVITCYTNISYVMLKPQILH
jgi:hypothetical protein